MNKIMTNDEKTLLVKVLYAMVPYNTYVKFTKYNYTCYKCKLNGPIIEEFIKNYPMAEIKPYLRDMESITDDEWRYLNRIEDRGANVVTDFYYTHHLDCWNLIDKGLAIKASDKIYKIS